MKLAIFKMAALLVGFTSVAQAQTARDSVGIFHRPEKVVVLITEKYPHGRIEQLFDAVGAGDTLLLKNPDQSITVRCGRNPQESSCTFRFEPSEQVQILPKSVVGFLPLSGAQNYQTQFQSSMGDKFTLKITAEGIHFWAGKKNAVEGHE